MDTISVNNGHSFFASLLALNVYSNAYHVGHKLTKARHLQLNLSDHKMRALSKKPNPVGELALNPY